MRLIRDVLEGKALRQLITIEPTATLAEASRLMAVWNVGALLVAEDGQLIGLISERELVRALAVGAPVTSVKVQDLMAREVRAVAADSTPDECMVMMSQLRLRYVTVMDDDSVLGVISLGDLVKDVIDEQAHVIEQLELYISRGANA